MITTCSQINPACHPLQTNSDRDQLNLFRNRKSAETKTSEVMENFRWGSFLRQVTHLRTVLPPLRAHQTSY